MPIFTVKSQHMAGFATETVPAGTTGEVISKGIFFSNEPAFHVYCAHIQNIFFKKIPF